MDTNLSANLVSTELVPVYIAHFIFRPQDGAIQQVSQLHNYQQMLLGIH